MISPEELGFKVFGYSGDEALVLCPYHDDHAPSARFNVKTGLFHCFVCGTGKKAKDIAKEFGGHISDVEDTTRKDFDDPTIDWRTRFLGCRFATDSEYLHGRNVPDKAVVKLGIRECDNGDIVFPLYSDNAGTICGVQVRQLHVEPKYVFYGTRPPLYPMIGLPANLKDSFLVEGIFGVIRGRAAGFNVFATLGSTALAPALRYFYDRTKLFGIFDPDAAGYLASAKLTSVGIPCLKGDFEADEMSLEEWKSVVTDKSNFTMDTMYFANKAVISGSKMKTIMNQILKFEKENV